MMFSKSLLKLLQNQKQVNALGGMEVQVFQMKAPNPGFALSALRLLVVMTIAELSTCEWLYDWAFFGTLPCTPVQRLFIQRPVRDGHYKVFDLRLRHV